jgi:UDP-N-acetylmuramyl pentapeptide phosphotransferase/UDP-N-acetylglucosamine-1-phosphate transferase
MLDDARDLTWKPKLVAQLMAAGGILSMPALQLGAGWTAIALIWLVGVTNAFNFMDGVNGIAAFEAMVCGTVMGVLFWRAGDVPAAVLAFAIAGGASGFFPWNAFTGSVFMGDVGSLPLGFLLAAFVLRGAADGIAPWVMALPLLPFLLDTGITLVRRIARRERIVHAHRSHFYQRLTDLGWSHVAVTGLWGFLAAVSGAVAWNWSRFGKAGEPAIAALFVLHLAVFALIGYRHSRRRQD